MSLVLFEGELVVYPYGEAFDAWMFGDGVGVAADVRYLVPHFVGIPGGEVHQFCLGWREADVEDLGELDPDVETVLEDLGGFYPVPCSLRYDLIIEVVGDTSQQRRCRVEARGVNDE